MHIAKVNIFSALTVRMETDYAKMRMFTMIAFVCGMTSWSLGCVPVRHGGYATHSLRESILYKKPNEFAFPNAAQINGNLLEFCSTDKNGKEHKLPFDASFYQLLTFCVTGDRSIHLMAIVIWLTKSDIIFPFHSFW